MTSTSSVADVIIVGCGCPLKSMGWYHTEQLLSNRCPSAVVKYIVEPYYMNTINSTAPGYNEFHTWRSTVETKYRVQFYDAVAKLPLQDYDASSQPPFMAVISARTADNPQLVSDCLTNWNNSITTIYLEKPGAPSVAELQSMKMKADEVNTTIYIGFNKNVSSYVTKTLDYVQQHSSDELDVSFVHNNAYENTPPVLAECFDRNAEGILKNMAIHELALLVTYYNVSVSNIQSVVADKKFSNCQTVIGPVSGIERTDFDKLKFTLTTTAGASVTIIADRCGGDDSVGVITDRTTGTVVAQYTMPDTDTVAAIPALEQKYPGAMPYFFTQDPDYCTLKERVAAACVRANTPRAPGVATIETAIEALQLAEYLTPLLQDQLKS